MAHHRDSVAQEGLTIFTGNAVPKLAADIAAHLRVPLGRATVGRFSDGEVMVEILENVRGRDCFVLQSTCAPTNDHLMELLIMVDALKRASAGRITAAVPYFGYARQDRRVRSTRVANIVDTANTLVKAASALKEQGAAKVLAYCTHPVLSGGAVRRVADSDLDGLVVTDTIPMPRDGIACEKIRVLSSAQLLAETILRINRSDSVSSLFVD
ncbi:MAG: ribose-phosphate diphosphokinase [Betaproteobacteria bacterium]|nr:ribose-phosphate diphosphokinase [Betaproteobacteria bacterium]